MSIVLNPMVLFISQDSLSNGPEFAPRFAPHLRLDCAALDLLHDPLKYIYVGRTPAGLPDSTSSWYQTRS
jgi:hypothetical protein